jgi:hypothetical protein
MKTKTKKTPVKNVPQNSAETGTQALETHTQETRK